MTRLVEITVFRSKQQTLTKRFSLHLDGTLKSDAACQMTEGWAYRTKLDGAHSLADLIMELRGDEALTLGRLRPNLPDEVEVVVKNRLNSTTPGVIARTTDFLQFAPGAPAYMLLDHDRKGMPKALEEKLKVQHGSIWRAIVAVVPELDRAAYVSRCSTSSGLYREDTDRRLTGQSNGHFYVAVANGHDIERALKTLHDRIWLAGYGYFVVGNAGQLLDRSIIDASVYGAERLVFEGAPVLVPPVRQDQNVRRPTVRDGIAIDTVTAIPPLTGGEAERLAGLKTESKRILQPQAAQARKAWAVEYAAQRGLSVQQAERIIRAASEQHTLAVEFELSFDRLGACTVADVVADPDRYVEETLADPLEGVAYGRGKAKVFRRRDELLMIHSFAHGGINYKLEGQGVTLEDFHALMEKHVYIFAPTRKVWPASSVDTRIPPVPLVGADGQPVLDAKDRPKFIPASLWLGQHRPVEQMTWLPGAPMIITNKLIDQGGWIERQGVNIFNLYRPPNLKLGNPRRAGPWLDHVHKVYPDDAGHILDFVAHRVQRPEEKINHGLVLAGKQGTGKDTMLEPVKRAVGPWNFEEVSPKQILGRFNGFIKSVILRVNEARDLGEYDRYDLHESMKPLLAAPPDVLRVDEKNLPEHPVFNILAVIITTNHIDGIFLTADDRRHYAAWTELDKEDFTEDYWNDLWGWYEHGGYGHVAAYLADRDLSHFNAKAPPPKTEAWWNVVSAGRNPEEADFADALDLLGDERDGVIVRPEAVTLVMIKTRAYDDFDKWLDDPKNRRAIPHRLKDCGYVQVRNTGAKDGLWKVGGKRAAIYARAELSQQKREQAAKALVDDRDERSRQLRLTPRATTRTRR